MPNPRSAPLDQPADRRVYDLSTVGKALDILEILAASAPLALAEITTRTTMSKASAFRVLNTLENRGYVSRDDSTRKWALGPRLIALSSAVVSSLDLVRQARPVLMTLHHEFGETVNLVMPRADRALYVDIIESRQGLRTTARVGSEDPLFSTALGKAILAALPWAEAQQILGHAPREARTPRTIAELPALERQLAEIRERGYAIDDEENELGVRCIGVAVLDREGHPVAAISLSGPKTRIDDERLPRIGEKLREARAQVEWLMGYRLDPAPGEGGTPAAH
jgi:IclR family acetate operon transcriptional repressor